MSEENQNVTTKPASKALTASPGSRWESPADDQFHDLGNGWAVILTGDGWELECQHSGVTIGLDATDDETAIQEGKAVAEIIAAENTSLNGKVEHE